MTDKEKRCGSCGYTEEDAKFHMDHRLCKNDGNAPWQKGRQNAAESLPAKCKHCDLPIKPIYPNNPEEGYVHIGYGDVCDFQYCINGGTFAEPIPPASPNSPAIPAKEVPVPKLQGGDYRPHYRKDEVDAYIARLEYERDVWRGKCKFLGKVEAKDKPTREREQEAAKKEIQCNLAAIYDAMIETDHGIAVLAERSLNALKVIAPQPSDQPTQKEAQGVCSCGHPKSFHYSDIRGPQCAYGDHAARPCKGFELPRPQPLLHDAVVEAWTKAENPEHQVCQSMAIELQQWRAWNAALAHKEKL